VSEIKKWRGLKALVQDAVENGSREVERIHLAETKLPFQVLAQLPAFTKSARIAHGVHDAAVSTSYAAVRLVNRGLAAALDVVLDEVEKATERERAQQAMMERLRAKEEGAAKEEPEVVQQ
jgi:hypothetical protein